VHRPVHSGTLASSGTTTTGKNCAAGNHWLREGTRGGSRSLSSPDPHRLARRIRTRFSLQLCRFLYFLLLTEGAAGVLCRGDDSLRGALPSAWLVHGCARVVRLARRFPLHGLLNDCFSQCTFSGGGALWQLGTNACGGPSMWIDQRNRTLALCTATSSGVCPQVCCDVHRMYVPLLTTC
jgi:hypothetical protein